MIKHALHGDNYLDVCKYYRHIYDTPSVKENIAKWGEVGIMVAKYHHEYELDILKSQSAQNCRFLRTWSCLSFWHPMTMSNQISFIVFMKIQIWQKRLCSSTWIPATRRALASPTRWLAAANNTNIAWYSWQSRQLVKGFITDELSVWGKIEKNYATTLKQSYVFDPSTDDGARRWKDLHSRVVEHVSPMDAVC